MSSRLSFTPRHGGPLVLPTDPIFNRLLVFALRQNYIAVRDVNNDIEKTFADLLSDVIHLRNQIWASLPSRIIADLEKQKEIYITLLAPGGYEFTVGVFAILAAGAAVSPISIAQPVDEAAYYVKTARSVALLSAQASSRQALALESNIRSTSDPSFIHIPISESIGRAHISPSLMQLSSNITINPDRPSLIIFTSGTTGPPKACVLRHATISDTALVQALRLNLQPQDTILHLLPVHHATGIWVSFFPFVLSGCTIEFKPGSFDPRWTWERFRQGQLTHFSAVPTIYMRMMRYYIEHVSRLPQPEQETYRNAVRSLKACMCGSSALPQPIDQFWTTLLGDGKRITQRYGSTELYVVFDTPVSPQENASMPDGSVGKLFPGVDLKLAPTDTYPDLEDKGQPIDEHEAKNGDEGGNDQEEGEVLVRSPHMFSRYLHDDHATTTAHDEQGYFRSGDIARRHGPWYFITGRASTDIIKSGGYKISALDLEREILSLPYINEVMIVGVADEEYGQRVGAVLSLRRDILALRWLRERGRRDDHVRLEDLRDDLRERLAGYKLPTLLRVIGGELPKSGTGKVVKKILGPKYFGDDHATDRNVQVWNKQGSFGGKSKL